MGWKSFNDRIALVLIVTIPTLWIVNHWLRLPAATPGPKQLPESGPGKNREG